MTLARGACVVCGQPAAGRARLEAVTGWESPEGDVELVEPLGPVVHTECWLRLDPAARARLLSDA